MRAFVLLLALLAGLKIWASEQLFRSAAEEALVAAYRDRAVAACQKEAGVKEPGRDVKAGLDLTAHFLELFVFGPVNRPLPPARVWLVERLIEAHRL